MIGDLLINSESYFNFIAPNFFRTEIKKHYENIRAVSGLSLENIHEIEFQLYRNIIFISEELIDVALWKKAEALVKDIDPKDAPYIAYSEYFKCKLWSGDKALMKGLEKKGFAHFITTNGLFSLREETMVRSR